MAHRTGAAATPEKTALVAPDFLALTVGIVAFFLGVLVAPALRAGPERLRHPAAGPGRLRRQGQRRGDLAVPAAVTNAGGEP